MWEQLVTTVYNSPYRTTQFQYLKFAFVRSRGGSKKKVIEKISTPTQLNNTPPPPPQPHTVGIFSVFYEDMHIKSAQAFSYTVTTVTQ